MADGGSSLNLRHAQIKRHPSFFQKNKEMSSGYVGPEQRQPPI